MSTFAPLPQNEPIKTVIKAAFDADLDIEGGWGYDTQAPLIIKALPEDHSKEQLQHMLASMRCYLEMHMTLPKEKRYGSINLNEKHRRKEGTLESVTYSVEAMKESDYERFINEYKEGYGKSDFDMNDHFRRRKAATLRRDITVVFDISALE